ncbi:MAG: NUDIX domain-containing protein [Waterburya sp.]
MTLKNRQEYLASLPKKIMGAGCLFFDIEGKILVVKPIYRDTWNLPGGVVEANESPQNACIREVKEEIGIEIKPKRLLCIDYTSKNPEDIESLQFIFFGGVLTQEKISTIKIATDEISAYQFLPPKQALTVVSNKLARRINKCLIVSDYAICDRVNAQTLYLEDQEEK